MFYCRISVLNAIHSIISLFEGDPTLLLEFNRFLPPGYSIQYTAGTKAFNVVTPFPSETIPQLMMTPQVQYFYAAPRPINMQPITVPQQFIPTNSLNTLPATQPTTVPQQQVVPNNSPNTSQQQPMSLIDKIKVESLISIMSYAFF